ncbi:bromodomain adjacent to zinc finger domain protein 1A isoform X1 [Notechis scutatus]|uniref:Bromodomain adjacent to zinc finger domain protein 1A n=1 Tax=Notechis scutatus TaxID=8663 RepID=A0A6J1TUV0_9SAUR|nr:bromodomain adjacent to zinc finger domain protein 1A isoform X1 [Notechis scutatus]XP_026520288.1 bromodomain adjacent to zinc finger domain protein 1A isoform X1 [Notechis scutatus]
MPLLHRKPFVREKPPADLRPDEHVFHCRVTNEIFRDYDEFFERTILCNSLVWSCAITGKSGLTYQEALESERKARQNIQNFPEPLIVPVLYLVTLTQRSRLHEVCDDIFAYIKNRYFVGELVEVLRNNGERLHCKILEIKAPVHQNGIANGHAKGVDGVTIIISDSDDSDLDTSSAQNGNEKAITDPFLYKYKVKPLKKQLYESVTVKASQICRRRHIFSYDRLKLFLKQHCESHDGIIKIKAISIAKYKIAERTFFYLFPDNPPTFMFNSSSKQKRSSKLTSDDHEDKDAEEHFSPRNLSNTAKERVKLQKEKEHMRNSEKSKREKENAMRFKRKEKQDKEKRKEELKKLVEEERLKKKEEKERLKIEKEKEREKLREEKKKYLEHLKQWSKRREDMECDDLKELPVPTPVKTRLPPEIFGDAVMVLEFLHAFGELFDLQDEFPDGVTLEVLEEALVGNDSEGPLCELLFFFLTAIFQAMAEEEEEVAKDQIADAETKDLTEALDEDADPTKSALSAVATLAAAWPQLHQGCHLKNLDLDSCTLSEILRLHILASGADVTSANAKYRYQKRGGFDTTDDACMELRLSNPGLLKKLSCTSVYDLSSAEKMRILHALCGKLLTLVSTRDFIEDSVDILRQTKQEFRELKAEQHRREREAAAAKIRRKKEERLKGQEQKMKEKHEKLKEIEKTPAVELSISISDEDREELDTSTESKGIETKEQEVDTMTDEEDNSSPNKKRQGGQNGFKDFTRPLGTTDDKCELLTAEEEAALKQEQQNKEKELIEKIQKATVCTNISSLGRDRLYRRYWLFSSVPGLFVEEDYSGLTEDMLVPRPSSFHNVQAHISEKSQIVIKTGESLTAESTSKTCQDLETSTIVNVAQPIQKPNKWCFYSSQEQFDQLLEALNSRGYRESALKDVLLQEKSRICEQFSSFPIEKFYISEKTQNEAKLQFGRGKMQNGCDMVQKSAEKQLELRLRDFLLDIEDRIFQGTLGSIKVMDRYSWRAALENGQYEFLNEENKENGVIKPVNENVEEMEIDNQVRILAKDRLIGLKPESRSTTSTNTSTPQPMNNTVHYLALALLQIQQGIERRFLKAPLDGSDGGRSHKTVLDRWRESLLSSASLSQIFLHLSTLERSVIWSKSILNTRCKMCRKKGDAESMVLCDGCDRGYHIYCIRPKLKAVPDGDWFCPECRPKQRSRRLSSRQRPSVESDEETIEEIKEEDETNCEEIGQSEDDYEEEEEDENIDNSDSQEDEKGLSKLGNSQVKFTLRTRAPKLASNQLSTGRYNSRSQQNTPKQIGSSYKGLGKNIRKTKSAPPSVTKTLRLSSRITRHKQEMLKADAFVELTSHRRQRRGMKTTDTVQDSSSSGSLGFRIIEEMNLRKEKSSPISVEKKSQDTDPPRRGRKRQSTGPPQAPLNRRTSGRQGGVHELSAFEQLVVELVRHDDSWPFMKLVSKIQVPDYYDIIKKPIALNIIREKVNKCEYKVASEFIEDVELMFSNCFEYNARNTSEAKAGTRLQAFFHVQAQKLGLPVASGYMNHVAPAAKKSRI